MPAAHPFRETRIRSTVDSWYKNCINSTMYKYSTGTKARQYATDGSSGTYPQYQSSTYSISTDGCGY